MQCQITIQYWNYRSSSRLKILAGSSAVSYTHLDVYKRQCLPWYSNHSNHLTHLMVFMYLGLPWLHKYVVFVLFAFQSFNFSLVHDRIYFPTYSWWYIAYLLVRFFFITRPPRSHYQRSCGSTVYPCCKINFTLTEIKMSYPT